MSTRGAVKLRLSDRLKARLDWPVALRPGRFAAPPFRVYVVASDQNRANVSALAEQAGGRIEVWPLDRHPGPKFDLLARLLRARPPGPDEWLVVADDDIRVVRGDLARLVGIARAAGLEMAQAGHDRRGYVSHGITVSRPLTRLRLTNFVECGPLFAVSPAVRDRVTATFAESGMGWGVEYVWSRLTPPIRLGVVNEVRLRHLQPVGTRYDIHEGDTEMRRNLAGLGLSDQPSHTTFHAWLAWQTIRPEAPADGSSDASPHDPPRQRRA